jgi:hypothetical protein
MVADQGQFGILACGRASELAKLNKDIGIHPRICPFMIAELC